MQAIGVNTIIRYYDHEDETLPGKTLRRGERDAILMNGFKMAVVFQHRNNRFASFTPLRGRQDAERSLALAAENSQPKGSAIYFGVDGPWKRPYELANIIAYFQEVKAQAGGHRLPGRRLWQRAGMQYAARQCARRTVLARRADQLARLPRLLSDRKWRLVQLPTSQCGGRSVDFNLANGADSDYGQFGR